MEREEGMCEGDRLKNQAEAFEEMILEVEISQEQPPGFSEILLAKPVTIFFGGKEKAITLIEEVANKPSLSSAQLKNVMEWNSELCQPMERHSYDLLAGEKLEEGSSATNDNDPPSLLIDDSANDLRKNAAHEKQDNREFTFWCDTCQIGTLSETVMESHKIEKNHKCKTKAVALAEAFEEMISEVPFRYRARESKISILNRSPKVEISQEQPPDFSGILLAKLDTIFSRVKWKDINLIKEVADKPSLSSAPVKNITKWNCELCQVCTTSQDGLNAHLQGKKRKRKVAALREHKDDKNCSISLLPKKPKLMQPMERPSDYLLSEEILEEGSSATNNNNPPSLLIDDSANDLRKNAAHEKQDNKEFTFLCDTCQIGTFSEIVMESHKIGKNHKCKTKTAALNDNKNWSIGLFPHKSKFIQLVERPCDDMISGKKSEEGSSSPNNNDPSSLLIDGNADDMRKNTDHEKQTIRGFTF
ncbi:hypothetical protein H5410_051903 [Solanum commersonii]|uniref:U1-type domain-containing protein n=1 Tax=Solanum commersonii TaxID=4109 RepID=A0A9J5X1U7_SOLCO|nr:hypothetical protein H5410_051903 [Solanum commersonii]